VFPSVYITILLLLVYALSAALTGALSGKLASALLGVPTSGPLEDGFLGMLGFVLLGFALVFVPPLGDFLSYRFANPSMAALIAAPVVLISIVTFVMVWSGREYWRLRKPTQ
jgi:hypothetical protein